MRVVAFVGSKSRNVFEYLVNNPPNVRIYALVGNGTILKSLGRINGLLALSREETSSIEDGRFNPTEIFPYLRKGDFLLMIGFSRGLFPKVLAPVKGESLIDTSLAIAQVGNNGPEGIQEVPLAELWSFLLKRVPEYPALLNCGLCGFETCKEYLRRAVEGEEVKCLSNHTFVSVNGKTVEMNPFIIKQLRVLIKAYLSTLKGINVKKMKEFHMKLDFD